MLGQSGTLTLKFVHPGSMEVGDFGEGFSPITILCKDQVLVSIVPALLLSLGRQFLEQCTKFPFEGILAGSLFHPPLQHLP